MAVSGQDGNQLLQELDIPSSSEEDGIPRVTPMRKMTAAFALCGVVAFAAVVVFKPATMRNMRASAQDAIGLAANVYECPTCKTNFSYSDSTYKCGPTELAAKSGRCPQSGCRNPSNPSDYCIQPINSHLTPYNGNKFIDWKYMCKTSPQNNPYECPATNGGCPLPTCEVGKPFDKTTTRCSEGSFTSMPTACGTSGCSAPSTPTKSASSCFAPNYTKLVETMATTGNYQWVCEYTGKNPSHPFMCPKPPPTAAQCVLGTSVVNTLDGEKLVRDTKIGDEILVNHGVYEPIIDFLHALPRHEGARVISAVHGMGRLSATAEHVVFVIDQNSQRSVSKAIEDVLVGDMLIDSRSQPHEVTDVVYGFSHSEGLFAPVTPSGTMIVDGMLMSNYAGVGGKRIPHSAMHAAFFLLRVWRAILPASDTVGREVLNPMAKFLWRTAGPLVLPASP